MTVSFNLTGEDRVIARFDNYSKSLETEVVSTMNVIVNYLVAYCKERKLSGQVLHRRKGNLSRSIKGNVVEKSGAVVGEVTSRDKGNQPLPYAVFWENGFHGTQTVRAHVRRSMGQMSVKRSQRDKKSEGEIHVRSFTRRVDQNARPFLAPTRNENLDYIRNSLIEAVNRVNKS